MNWIEQELKRRQEAINQALDQFLLPADAYPPVIHQAMRYSVMGGGKRLRPVLVGAAAEVVGGSLSMVLPAAVAVECIHSYSLIHDDLPAMDDDDFRRGQPTCHRVFGEAIAILAGDALLTLAFEFLARLSEQPEGPPALVVLQVIRELAEAAGTQGMIGGQVLDLEAEKKPIDAAGLEAIHRLKTGALIRAAVRSGAMLAGASPGALRNLTIYAEELGLAFQITDDILDEIGEEKQMGKPVGSDRRHQKATFPALYGIDTSLAMARGCVERAVESLREFGEAGRFLRELAHYVLERRS